MEEKPGDKGVPKICSTHAHLLSSLFPGATGSAFWIIQELLSQAESRILEVAMLFNLNFLSISCWRNYLALPTKLDPNAALDCPPEANFFFESDGVGIDRDRSNQNLPVGCL